MVGLSSHQTTTRVEVHIKNGIPEKKVSHPKSLWSAANPVQRPQILQLSVFTVPLNNFCVP
jgi:hypothetical protein